MKIKCTITYDKEFEIKDENLSKILLDVDSDITEEYAEAMDTLEKIIGYKIGGKEITKEKMITAIEDVETGYTIYEW